MPKYSRTVEIPGKKALEIYEKVLKDVTRWQEKGSFGKMDVKQNPSRTSIDLKGMMFEGTLILSDGKAQVDFNLSLFAAPFRSKIDEQIDRWITKSFSENT